MKVLVTGGAGFIGTNVCESLVKKGHLVRVIDNLSVSDVNVPYLLSLGIDFIKADIANYVEIRDCFIGVDAVIHLAAMNRAQRSINDPLSANQVNVNGTLHCLEAARQNNIKKFINISSSSVYANREGDFLKEDAPLAPLHPYGVGKLAGEQYARVYWELYGLKTVSLRLFSVYGPYQLGSIDKAGVVAKFMYSAINNIPLEVYGSGEQLRNFSYVADVTECIFRALESEAAIGHIINVANSREISINSLTSLVKKISKKDVEVIHIDPLKGDPERNPADINKCSELLNFKARFDFEEGLEKTFQWYSKNLEV